MSDKTWRISFEGKPAEDLKADNMIVTPGGSLIATTAVNDKQMTLGAWAAGSWTKVEQLDETGNIICKP